MAAQQVGSLYLEVFLDPTQYYAQIQAVEKRAREMATRIEREWKQAPLRPRVDDRELTDLNRHLDLKRRHYSEVKNYIESNPIKLKVDSSQLNKIDTPVSKSVQIDVNYRVSGAIPQIKDSKIKVDIQLDTKNLKSFASVVGDELEDVGKNIVKGIKKATNRGAIGGIFQGFYEGIGNTYAETLTRGAIKGIEGKFGVSIRNLGKQSSEAVIGGGNTLLKKLGISDAKKSVDSANQVFKDLFPADIIEKKLDRVETRFNKLFDSLTKFKSAQENLSNLGAIGQELGSFGQIPFEKIKADRKKKIEEIAQQIKQEQKQNPIKVNIPSEAERMVFATGGFAGAKGKSGNWVASKLQMLLGNKSAVVPVENPYSDVSASVGDIGPLRWSAEAAYKTLKTPIKHKVNPDAVSMARQAYAAHLENPTLPVRLAGYSFGGQTANDSLEILKALGVKDVKAVGMGSPSFGKLSSTSRSDFQIALGKGDGVKRLQDMGAFFAGQGKNLNITPVQGHELSSYLADPKSQEIILKQIEGDKARVRKELQNPDVFRLVDYKKNIEQMLAGVESLLTSPVSDPSLQKNLMGANLQGIEETRQELDKILGTLSKEITQNFDEHYQALVEAENILRDLLGANSQPQPRITQQAQKNNESAKQILAMQSKRAILEPLGTEFGIKGARKLKKDELINNLADKVPLDILKQKLPYTVDPGQEVLQSVAKRQTLDTNSLKLVTEQSLKSIKERSGKSLRGSQLIDLSSDIEREYQIVLGLLAKNISEDSKKVLESAKMLLGKLRASAIRNAVAEVGERNQPKQQIDQSIRQGLARVLNKDVFEPIKRLKETSQEQLKQNYLKIAEALSAAQEVKFDPKQLPELVIDESALRNMGADAFYDTNKNQILITKAIEQALKEKPKQLARQSEVLKTLAHELRHAYQSDFGNIPLADLIKGKSAIPLIPRNQAPKSALDAARYNVKMLHRDNPKMGIAERMGIERLEVDAYASEKYARFASKALQTSGQDVRQTRQEAIDDTLKNVAQAIEDFANRVDEMAPVLRSSFERLTKDATTNFNKLFASIKHFIHMQINPLPKTVLNREGMARVNPLKRPDEAFAFMGDVANYAKVLEFNARTMPAGSKETSRQRFTNRILPRNVRRQMAQGGQALEEGFFMISENIPEIMKNPVVNRVLEYKLKFEIKGWSDVLEMLYKDVDKLFQGIENKAGESKYFGEFLQQIVGGMKNLNLTTIATGVAFFRFFSMLKYTGYLVALGTAVLATATAFEALNRRFTLTAQSSIKAQASLSNLMQSAKDLRLSRDALLTGGADIQASLRSRISDQTQIDKILQSAATSARIYGTNPQDTQQILGGFANLAAEPTLSQSSFQQLQTTVPDIYSVAARAAGTSEQGFMQGLQRGEYTTSEFLPVLSQQLNAENSTKTASAIDTMSAATQRMANATEELQLAFSDFAIPFSKFTTNAFAQALEMAVKGAQLFASALTGLAFWSIYKFGKALVTLGSNVLNIASKIPLVGTAMLAMARIAQQVAANILPIIGKMAKEFILFQIVVDVFTIVSTAMKDSSGEIGRAAENITKNLNKFQEALRKTRQDAKLFSQELPKSFQEVKGKSYLEDTFFGGLLGKENARAIEDFDTRRRTIIDRGLTDRQKKRLEQINPELVKPSAISRSEKEAIDRGKRVDQITAASSQINTAIQSQLTGDSELKQLSNLDKQLASIQNRRRAMAVVDPSNRKGFNELKQQEEELLKLRQRVSTPVEALSGASTSVVQGLQEALTEYERLASERLITQDEYTKRTTEIKTALEAAEKSQEDFNKQMRNAITPLQAFERAWIRITGALESSRNAITLTANVAKQKLAEQEIQGIATPGISSQTTGAIELESLQKQAQATRETIAQMYAEMESRDSKEIFGALGVNKGTSGLEVRALAERSEGLPMQKALLEKLAETKDLELNLSELDTQIAQARANAQKTLVDLNKQVADYYRGISRNAQQQGIEMQRLSYQVQVTQQQNKLRSALLDGYDTIVSQFIDSIIDSIGQFNQVGDRALEAQSQLLTNRFNLEDTLRSGVELSRNLPTVPIKLDFSGIPADNNIVELGRQVQEAIDGSNNLGESINGATSNADDLYKQLMENLKPLDDANKNLTDTASNFDSVNQKAQESSDLAKQFGGELGAIPSQVANIDQGFVGIVTSLGTIITKTVEWLANLGGAKESIEGIANNMGKHPFLQGIQQIGQGILQAGSYGIASPSTTQSLEQVLKGSVSQGQGFFGQRARGNHASIDFDGTEGLGGGAAFQAMFPGRVASTRAWGNGYRDVDGGNSNAIRIISKLPGGLGEFSTDYGHYKASTAKVQEGQDILAGTKLGALSQKDSISSGGHLDLKIRIPSTIANQFRTTQSAGGGQSFVEVKEFMKWYQSQLGKMPQEQQAPITKTTATGTRALNASEIARKNKLQSLLVTDTKGREIGAYNAGQAPNSPASTIKLVLADVVTDRLSPDQQVKINRSAVGQYEDKFKAGQTTNVNTLLKEMLGDSNNTAFNALVQALGGVKTANNLIKAKGYSGTQINSLLSIPGASAGTNVSTARDTTKAMASLLNGNMPGDKVAEEALRSTRNFKFQGETGGKIGNNSKVVGNVGIINIGGAEYLVTAYANVDGNKANNRKLITNATNEIAKGLMSGATSSVQSQTGRLETNSQRISRGGNPLSLAELARLTKEGQQLYQLQRNPNVLAFADVVARAEGTDFRNNSKNFGYSMMIGGEHDTDFSRHPFAGNSGSRIRAPRHNSTASGRYQMMDFNYSRTQAGRQFGRGAKSDLASVFQGENPGSFSPGVQDLYFTASLKSRGILDEVLAGNFEAALKNPSIAKHYASLQSGAGRSAYKGQGTPEGQLKNTIPFAQQRLIARRREGAPVSVAADNFSAATPGQMRNGVLQGMNLAVQTAQQGGQRETLITKQSEADQERARQEAVRKANQALRQYERARRDQEDRSITNQRGVTDFGISAIKNPSPAQRRLQESTQIKRQTDDLIKEREREIENRQKQIEQSQEILRNKSYLAAPNAAAVETQLKQGIKENEKEIPRLAKQIDEIKKIGTDYQKNVEAIFAREDNQRRQTADFEAFQGEIAKAQKQLEGLQQLQQVSPLDERVFDIFALQEEVELKQAALDLDKAIFDEENKLYSYSINQHEYDRRIEQIKQENIVRQENAMARRQQAEAEQELQKVQRQLEVRAQATSMNNEYLQNMMQLRQLGKGGRNPLDIQREMNLAQMDSDFAQREFEINRNRNRTPEERERELESLRQIRQSRTDVINAELARNQEDNQIAARDLFNKSNLDIVGTQASNMRVFGQDNRARQLEKGMAIFQQQTAFQDQIRELERLAQTNEEVAKSADLIRANYEELNKIKLDEIENQFNEFLPAIQEIKGATQGLFSDLLSGADNAFANFGKKILDYFTQLAAQMLTNDLFGAIGETFGMKGQQAGGGGGQIFDLLGGLLGGLFYNGGYVPNYAKGYNPLQDALKREHAQTGKRAYVAVLSEGERVLNIDETRKFHAMGGDNILRFAEGGMVGATSSFSPTSGGNVSVNNNIVIGGNSENTDVGAFRTVLDGRIREIIREEQRPGRSLNRKRR
jgi:muramidase (phage lysozyme)